MFKCYLLIYLLQSFIIATNNEKTHKKFYSILDPKPEIALKRNRRLALQEIPEKNLIVSLKKKRYY